MPCLQLQVEQIDLRSGPGPTTMLGLGPPGSDHAFDVQLIGAPGPGLFGRTVTLHNPSVASWPDAKSWQIGDWGALLEASIVPSRNGWRFELVWAGRFGVTRIEWEGPRIELHTGDPIAADPPEFQARVRALRESVEARLAEWKPRVDLEDVSDREALDRRDESIPTRELFQIDTDYACVLHQCPEFREAIVLELYAKYARYRQRVLHCEHMDYLDIYTILTHIVLPRDKVNVCVPRGGSAWGDLAEHCSACTRRLELEYGGEAWPPHSETDSEENSDEQEISEPTYGRIRGFVDLPAESP